MTEVLIKIRDSLTSLSEAEQAVGQFILTNVESAVTLPISELSERSMVSRSTWIRFSKSMGYSGLKELKREMVKQLNSAAGEVNIPRTFSDVDNFDSCEETCLHIKNNAMESLEQTYKLLNYDALRQASRMILKARAVGVFGMGASGLVAQDMYYKLLRIGVPVMFTQDFHTNMASVAAMDKGDVAIFFSHSGRTRELVELAALAKSMGCNLVSVTKFGKSPLQTLSQCLLYTTALEQEMRSGAMSSRLAQLFIVDALFTTIAKMGFGSIEVKLMESYTQLQKHKIKGEA